MRTTYIILGVLVLVVLWYAFGRKAMFMNSCKKTIFDNQESLVAYTEQDKINECEQYYRDFTGSSNVNWSPIAFY